MEKGKRERYTYTFSSMVLAGGKREWVRASRGRGGRMGKEGRKRGLANQSASSSCLVLSRLLPRSDCTPSATVASQLLVRRKQSTRCETLNSFQKG